MIVDKVLDALKILKRISEMDKDKVINDPFISGSLLWNLYVAVQGCIDLGLKVASKLNLSTPETYSDVFRILHVEGFIPEDLKERLISMAKFRNILAHLYLSIDIIEIHNSLKSDISDIKEYLRILNRKLKELGYDILKL
ncbi:MAG: type VII toxin-antitoxin system HepT family RNase toxin [Candidatus Asgardarchaeia archaeon]